MVEIQDGEDQYHQKGDHSPHTLSFQEYVGIRRTCHSLIQIVSHAFDLVPCTQYGATYRQQILDYFREPILKNTAYGALFVSASGQVCNAFINIFVVVYVCVMKLQKGSKMTATIFRCLLCKIIRGDGVQSKTIEESKQIGTWRYTLKRSSVNSIKNSKWKIKIPKKYSMPTTYPSSTA